MTDAGADGRRVVVVTGGGGGIGAAVAEQLGAAGCFVVTVDPLVSVDGAEQLPAPEETTASRIVASGGAARASSASVTDAHAVRTLFEGLVEELGRLDAVVNVAGITRLSGFAKGTEADWRDLLSVHLDGYLNVLRGALPIMADLGRGHILGVTSGSGWRAADTGAYGCAKRAVASLTWQLGLAAPPGVFVNAMSPIAATRMVTAALSRAPASGGSAAGGLSLGSMPAAEEIGPIGAHLVGPGFGACRGQVVFVSGAEVAVVHPPQLLEVVRTDDLVSLPAVLSAVVPGALAAAEAAQSTNGGSNPRFPGLFDAAGPERASSALRIAVVAGEEDAAALAGALTELGAEPFAVELPTPLTFESARAALDEAEAARGPLDGVVVALAPTEPDRPDDGAWEGLLEACTGLTDQILADAAWARATADLAARTDRPMRLVTLTRASTAAGRTGAQSVAQLSRSAGSATAGRVAAFAISVEAVGAEAVASGLAAHLLVGDDVLGIAGAELLVGDGHLGLRSHPRPTASITYGGPATPRWLDDVLEEIAR